jgi:predicted NBD/HSP70 family sugar kinase
MMAKQPLGNRDLIRAINRSAVLNTIKNYGPISRTEIARKTGLSAATITGISTELLQDNLIFEKEEGDSSGGRRPILLALNPRGGFVVGLKLTEENVTGALTDLEATVIAKQTLTLKDQSLDKVINSIVDVIEELEGLASIEQQNLFGVGIGLAGIVDADSGVLRYSPIFGWHDVPFVDLVQSRLNVPVFIDNDVNTFTLTERWFGKGRGVENFLTVTVGRGIGMGIVVNGQLYQGVKGGAGEFGHTVINPEGPMCDCGKRGCLEVYVSDPALVKSGQAASESGKIKGEVRSIADLQKLAEEGDPGSVGVYVSAGEMLGRGIANLINVFNPELIIVGGEGVRAGDLIFEPMCDSIAKNVMPGLVDDTEIKIELWNDDAWARGAAGLVLRELFESPIHREVVELL